jgi:phage terminase large subunit-like protein
MTRGGRICFFSSFRSSRLAACLSRRRWTEKTELNDPDWTVSIKLGRDKNRGYWLLDMVRGRANPGDVERLLLDTVTRDGRRVRVGFGKDPGQVGKSQAFHLVAR